MVLRDHLAVACANERPVTRALLNAGSAAQANLQAVTLEMSRDVVTAPVYVRPTGQNHPRAIFPREDPVLETLRQWAAR